MDTQTLRSIIDELDEQLGKINPNSSDKKAVERLLTLRNNIILKHKPDPSIDWTIKNKKALEVISSFQWVLDWKYV